MLTIICLAVDSKALFIVVYLCGGETMITVSVKRLIVRAKEVDIIHPK